MNLLDEIAKFVALSEPQAKGKKLFPEGENTQRGIECA